MENKNTYRIFAFSEQSINKYSGNTKNSKLDLINYPQFDTIIMFFIGSDLVLGFLKNGKKTCGATFGFGSYPEFHFPIELAGEIKILQPEQKEESLFHVGDRVYQYFEGWGTVTNIDLTKTHPISVKFDSEKLFHFEINETKVPLSFTEYNFITGGWSQERPKPLPKVGDIGWFWRTENDIKRKSCFYGELTKIQDHDIFNFKLREETWFKYFSTEKPF